VVSPADVAARLVAIAGVRAVVLGGSRARGDAAPDSDVDLGLYYDPASPPSRDALNTLARELDDRRPIDAVTGYGEWGPWINGGAWLTIDGTRVDWLFKDLARIRRVVAECRAGRPEVAYQLGHPHAFVSAIYLGEIDCCVPLADPDGLMPELKALVRPYPALLRDTLVQRFLFEADFSLDGGEKGAARGDVVYVAGCVYRTIAALVQVLYAVNERYCTNEKGALRAVAGFAHVPDAFAETAARLLGAPGTTPTTLGATIAATRTLSAAVRSVAAWPAAPYPT
jgi:predicted nucleotidyltransferase